MREREGVGVWVDKGLGFEQHQTTKLLGSHSAYTTILSYLGFHLLMLALQVALVLCFESRGQCSHLNPKLP